ncbi:DUF6438 domain-containing protein [Mucilaginibacter lacusdianchii]|uniref:DUF6438 domain-containing protein n=1 Tax=Mucilaginibacter lacusdianchii TaxID=2684211 RepID=UPI00131AF37A|nr:DUF6438 domain-containing protein [Mucilaginibacter sp. JXJ CY 39]
MNLPAFTFKASLQLFAVLTSLCLLAACHHKVRINKVELATGHCYGYCQPTAVCIDSDFNYYYYGDTITPFLQRPNDKNHDRIEGYFVGKINKQLWDTLINKLYQIDFEKLDDEYQRSVDDQSLELIVYYQSKTKHVRAQSASLPKDVRGVLYWIANSYKRVKLMPSKDNMRFKTSIHKVPWY